MAEFQPAWGLPDEPPLFGTITTSYLLPGREGIAAAKASLGKRIIEPKTIGAGGRGYLQAIEALAPRQIGESAIAAVNSLEVLESSPFSADEIAVRYKLLSDLEGGASSRNTREISDRGQQVVDKQIDELRKSLFKVFDESPGSILEAVADCRAVMGEFQHPESPSPKLCKLRNILHRLNEIGQFEDWLTADAFESVRQALPVEGRKAAEEALAEVIVAKTWQGVQNSLQVVENFLRELETAGVRLREQVRAVGDELVARECSARVEQDRLKQSVALLLPGPDEGAVLTGMKTAADCSDLESLVRLLADKFERTVRDHAAENYPHVDAEHSSVPVLLLEMTPRTIAELIEEAVDRLLGVGHSLFELIECFGVAECVGSLYRKAGPTCFHAGRATEAFGLSPTEIMVVRIPRGRTATDEATRSELKSKFEALSTHCHVEDGTQRERTIYVTRTNTGWPIGIEQGNHVLAQKYGAAARQGHRMHLHGLLPDTEAGAASAGYLTLVSRLAGLEEEIQHGIEQGDSDADSESPSDNGSD